MYVRVSTQEIENLVVNENAYDTPEVVVVIGQSGAGKRAAIGILEDLYGYRAITKVEPADLVRIIQEFRNLSFGNKLVVHLAMQEFSPENFSAQVAKYIEECVGALKKLGDYVPKFKIVFLYCAQSELANRQSYGFHVLKNACGTLRAAIFKESEILVQLFEKLTEVFHRQYLGFIDTSGPKQMTQFHQELEEQIYFEPETTRKVLHEGFITRGWNNMDVTLRQIERLSKVFRDLSPKARTLNCLIIGETGTGKEHVAKMLHEAGAPKRTFQVLDCTSIPTHLLESELWGVKEGAYTDAGHTRDGLVASAANGTLFLDEIGLTDKTFQAKLLRFIETRSYRRLGETKEREVERCQVISATSRNLEEEAKNGSFLPDLFYRLAAITITIPPLCERREDIPLLVNTFSTLFRVKFTNDALAILMDYAWPGNVRELKQVIERCSIMSETPNAITAKDLPTRIVKPYLGIKDFQDRVKDVMFIHGNSEFVDERNEIAKDTEYEIIVKALTSARGNVTKAAEALGVERTKFNRTLTKFDIDADKFRSPEE